MDRQVRSNYKVMLTDFFNSRELVHNEYALQGQKINKEYYRDVLRRLRDAVRRKREDLWSSGNWRLHYDNAPAHSSHLIKNFWQKKQTPVLQQAPYSPDMAPCDFWLFHKIKRPLKGTRFQTREDIMAASTAELNSIPKEAFSACSHQWRNRWEKSVDSQGNYFEGD